MDVYVDFKWRHVLHAIPKPTKAEIEVATKLKYSFLSTSILNRLLLDIFDTLIMAAVELLVAFDIEDFYQKDISEIEFIMHESYYSRWWWAVLLLIFRVYY
jgi:hypothetical protein